MLRRLLPLAVLSALLLAGCGNGDTPEATDPPTPTGTGTTADTTSCSYPANGQPAAKEVDPPSGHAPADGAVAVTLRTSAGDVAITMDRSATPCAVNSFVSLAQQGYFDKTPCHRLTTRGIFVLQCGDPTGTGTGGPGYSFDDELRGDETYPAGTVAMANAGPDTNGSQFFLVYADTTLRADYDVLGTMDKAGIRTVKKVAAAGTDDANGPGDGHPTTMVQIESVSVG